jgi:hypothetical protein
MIKKLAWGEIFIQLRIIPHNLVLIYGTPNKQDQDQIQRTECLCKFCVHLSLYISWMQARYADVLDKKIKTLQSTSLKLKL